MMPMPALAMDAGSLDSGGPKLNCSQLVRKVTRLRKQYEAEDYELAQMQVQLADVKNSGNASTIKSFEQKIDRQEAKVKDLKSDLRDAERDLAKAKC